jgi:hypothetical protein
MREFNLMHPVEQFTGSRIENIQCSLVIPFEYCYSHSKAPATTQNTKDSDSESGYVGNLRLTIVFSQQFKDTFMHNCFRVFLSDYLNRRDGKNQVSVN